MNAHPQTLHSRSAAHPLPAAQAVSEAIDSLMDRRGMVRVVTSGRADELLFGVGDRLPSNWRWCVAQAPRSPAAVWNALFEGSLPQGQEPGPALREMLWRRAQRGVNTILGVTADAALPDEILSVLEELAGLEPMLQVFLVSDPALAARRSESAMRLAYRLRRDITVASPKAEDAAVVGDDGHDSRAPISVDPAAPVMASHVVAPKPHESASVLRGAAPASQDIAPASRGGISAAVRAPIAGEAPAVLTAPEQLEAASQRTVDPFRGRYIKPALDSPDLLPVLSDPHGVHAEWFRVLRLRLEDWVQARGGAPQSIAISGPAPGVGKTFVAVNLALLWANSTFERVLLIDGDLRCPQFHSLFEIRQRPGLADVLARRCAPADCTTFVKEVGLHVLPAGRAGNPRQLVNPDRVLRTIGALKESYDVVIMDGPPLTGLVDARSFAGACDGTLLVARGGQTTLSALEKSVAELPPDRLIGAVVNGADTGVESAYSRYRSALRG